MRFLWWVVVDSFRVWLVMLGIFWVVVGDVGFTLVGPWFILSGGKWQWVYSG